MTGERIAAQFGTWERSRIGEFGEAFRCRAGLEDAVQARNDFHHGLLGDDRAGSVANDLGAAPGRIYGFMFRRISTKWVLSVLAVGVVPFLGFAWFVNVQMADRLWDVVRYYLQSIAADLAEKVDDEVQERQADIRELAGEWMVEVAIQEGADGPSANDMRQSLENKVHENPKFDLILIVDEFGRYVASNERDYRGAVIAPELRQRLREEDYRTHSWFREAVRGERVLVDQHMSELSPPRNPSNIGAPENYQIGFAMPVLLDPTEELVGIPSFPPTDKIQGVVYGLVNWGYIQYDVLKPQRGEYFEGLTQKDIYSSAYAWLWSSDCDTILAHSDYELYGSKVSEDPIDLPQLVAAARAADAGLYPEYEFRGVKKNAAFQHCAGLEDGGFGWVVGIGINNSDIYGTIEDLRRVLLQATFIVLGGVVLWTIYIARRTTRPIILLQQHTRRIAAGDLDTRIEVTSRDELGDLADSFNLMARQLRESREVMVKAEKEAAWREMARQVAHEIKNPLTPISLSANLLLRARKENSSEFDEILERTIDMIQRQVGNMRDIASDFSAFAGARHSNPEPVDLKALLRDVLAFNEAWASELGVEIRESGNGGRVFADPRELERVLINLISNAFESMPEGGTLEASVETKDGLVVLEIRDTGTGLSDEARERLFEPYFTTRSHGTGLGLAICKRVIDEFGGKIELRVAEGGVGTLVRVELPELAAE